MVCYHLQVSDFIRKFALSNYKPTNYSLIMLSLNYENHVRSYGRTELAKIYFPQMNPDAAWHKLRSWLRDNPRLEYLYAKRTRSFTPAEVSLIFSELGEP